MFKKSMKRALFAFSAFIFFSQFPPHSAASMEAFSATDFKSVSSKAELEKVIIDRIEREFNEKKYVNMDQLSEEFRNLGDNYEVKILKDKISKKTIFRFSKIETEITIKNLLKLAPGASSGRYTAIFESYSPLKIAIVRRGGEIEWLK